MLKWKANHSWEAKQILEESSVISWFKFTKLFLKNYFLKHLENQIELKQENMSVVKYEAKFDELSRFFFRIKKILKKRKLDIFSLA